ncbi:UDP-N-acetylmuramoyl-L-alanyl-D-glutamate--2,6-diaminopimelate ligase [Dokdonella sp.]|uniref:UDP-N-acetylmuramoyl-L-alanyl-D-glutamate--2, 6-diaminopimelate ligase n=1 Tax=Dokdonella sp. TaxID=2291710 RepID=UPI001B2AF144|nr:UDP-N-acetylmuramoyl-L-alanyl-D-glutamate--2,6-diaminopimelate ligase [Dokdonella sp.]MBO9665070.1 UDP-N-acetylmuramoyl-L-alanyl-D-glutamate--2,6-diaminopimelate ligase [Dokdonella sp.]
MSRPPISLRELLQGRAEPGAAGDILVHGLALDSRRVQPGDAFVALRGTAAHGIAFAPAAVERGAVAVLAEDAGIADRESEIGEAGGAPVVWVEHLRGELGAIASHWFGEPSHALQVIGVTGTNGKTSTVQLLAQALHGAGRSVATIGTLGAGPYGAIREGERTTPDVIAVHGLLAGFRDEGATHVAMEVSSHALDQGRVNAVAFDLAVFTNLTRDHLDYHGTMDAYGAAKQRLFAWPGLGAAIVNVDDAFGRALVSTVGEGTRLLRYGIERDEAEVIGRGIETGADGLMFHLTTPWGEGEVATRLLGRFNVSNLLAVAACLGQLGFSFAQIRAALAALEPVAGRMNRLGGDAQPLVVIDYAHTPDALEQALTSLRAHCSGHLICVFGCGGERDAGKRPQMGAIAEALADRIVVTDDNPRGEDGDAIVAQIVAGLARPQEATIERDRAGAISLAIAAARPGDVVLIAGKGHEPYQEIAGRKQPFDDLAVARRVLEMRAW